MTTITFDVAGLPVPQGSMRAFVRSGHAVVTHNKRASLDAWRSAIATEARAAMDNPEKYSSSDVAMIYSHAPFDMIDKFEREVHSIFYGPLLVRIVFRLPRPKSHYGKRGLLPSAPDYPAGMPDIDKLARAALDAMTGVVWSDDAQVSDLRVRKDYCELGQQPGCSVTITERVA